MNAKHILLVEDDPGIRLALARALESHGHTVVTVTSGREAIDIVVGQSFDLLVLDINLPDITGWDVLRCIAAHDVQTVPLIVMSAVPPSVGRLREFPPMGVLTKPFPIDLLHRMVDGVSSLALERMINE